MSIFPATIGRFDGPADRANIDGLVHWVEERYREDLAKRPSKHVYVRTLPTAAIAEIDRLRDSPVIRGLIAREVPAGSAMCALSASGTSEPTGSSGETSPIDIARP